MNCLNYSHARESGPAIVSEASDPEPQTGWVVVAVIVGAVFLGTILAVTK